MKSFLILFLLFASLNCNSLDIAKCILTNGIITSFTSNLISAIKAQDWTKTSSTVISNFDKVITIIKECNKKDEEKEKDEQQKKEKEQKCLEECQDMVDYHEKEECFKDCYFKYY